MRKTFYIVTALVMIASMLLAACGTPTPAAQPATDTPAPVAGDTDTPAAPADTDTPAPTATLTPYPMADCQTGKVCVRWFIGLGTGTDPVQLTAEQSVVDDFNASQDKIQLIMEVVPYASAKDTILTEIAAGNGPDVIGPVGWNGSATLHGQWADLKAEIAAIPEVTAKFDPALVKSYESSEGQIGLPFAVYPSAIFYNASLFDEAGLEYPPAKYGANNGPATYKLDGKDVEWNWDTVKTVAQRLTVDANGKNASEDGFDKTKVVQYGFTWNFEGQPSYLGAFWANGSYLKDDGKTVEFPEAWKAAWKWTYDGIWGTQPFIPNGQVQGSADFGNGNPFNSNKVGMVDQPVWYTCCMGTVTSWDAGALPAYKGKVAGRVDADTFRIWKGTQHKAEAFQVLTYLVTTGVQKLIIGSKDLPAAYGALPARAEDQAPWLEAKKVQFPWVKNWDVVTAGLSFPDAPSAESWFPNYNEGWNATGAEYSRWLNTGDLDMDKEIETFLSDLQAIVDKGG